MLSNVINFLDKKGKIVISSIDNYNSIDADMYLLCSTYSGDVPEDSVLVEQLAPSFNLLVKKNAWLEKKVFIERYEEFKEIYLNEIRTRQDYKLALDKLKEYIHKGKTIVLYDDCHLKKYCHLNILKEELKNLGYRVDSNL